MPSPGLFHSFFFNFSDSNAAPVHIGRGGYPGWQASVIAPSLFGMVGAWIDARWALVKYHWRLAKRVHALSRESQYVVTKVIDTLEDRRYPFAQQGVRKTAKTLGFSRPEAWKELSRAMKADPGRAENTFRHMHAMKLLRELSGSTCTNPDANLLVELAYQGFTYTRT